MAAAIRNSRFILEKEDTDYVWKFEAILEPIILSPNVRTNSIIYGVKSPPATIDIIPNSPVQLATTTKHQGFQVVQHQPATTSPPTSAPKEINPAPAIFAGMMLLIAAFHGWGFYQYYRGSIDNQMECKQ